MLSRDVNGYVPPTGTQSRGCCCLWARAWFGCGACRQHGIAAENRLVVQRSTHGFQTKWAQGMSMTCRIGILTISDVQRGNTEDKAARRFMRGLRAAHQPVAGSGKVIPDDSRNQAALCEMSDVEGCSLIVTPRHGPALRDVRRKRPKRCAAKMLPGSRADAQRIAEIVPTAILVAQTAGIAARSLILNYRANFSDR